ncbi:hypothetical protein FSARC_13260 [Fusarium sarcochroum]|uniref:Extracellular membrane protein CFEM domain-containing protein n=1 Tax=Fusarium sarcochroum TaxID=1208366 RepID=A0A8H4T2V3_9HYPO|nr:hypothetical protein FSARC_13260 [Fusarium sarcochroum]
MTRLLVLLAVCLFTAVRASNPVFGGYVSSSCDSCLDETYQSCAGDYKTRPYATCICDPGLNEPANVSAAWFRYCVMFFKDMCPAAKEYIETDTFDKHCSEEAIAAGGIGEKEDGDSDTDKDSESNTDADERKTGDTSETSAATQTTNGATPTFIPAWAIVAGLALQLIIT